MCDCHAQISHNNVKVASFLATETSAKLLQLFYACLKKRTIISENLQLEGHEAMKPWHCTLHLNKNPDTQQPDNKSFKLNNQMFYLFSPFVQHWQVISDLIINAWLSRTAGRHLGWNDRCCSFSWKDGLTHVCAVVTGYFLHFPECLLTPPREQLWTLRAGFKQ